MTGRRWASVKRRPLLNRSRAATFLCYHSIASDGPEFLSISPELFETHLRMLRAGGYSSGGIKELRALATGGMPSAPTVFITFDDGFADNAECALPLLREYGFRALFFVLPKHVESRAPLAWPEVGPQVASHPEVMRSLGWDDVGEMTQAGMEIGSHTVSHPNLTTLDDDHLRQELLDSRRLLVDRLGACDMLAYPFGHWSPRVAASAAAAGYSFAFSLPDDGQIGGSALAIPRLMIDHRDDERRFAVKLSPWGRRLWLSPLKGLARTLTRSKHG